MRTDSHITFWVTSRCNLNCPKCNQRPAIEEHPNYEMPLEELKAFIASSQQRGIHYAAVELTGGEPTLWPHFAEGLRLLRDSGITDWPTFVTNGRDAEYVALLSQRLGISYGLSATQATKEQVTTHLTINPNTFVNREPHRQTPAQPIPNSLPAVCVVEVNRQGRKVLPLAYYKGRIYHCCTARSLRGHVKSVSFQEDFLAFFTKEPRNQIMCSQCLCNSKVWSAVE